ncbi:hypothetical protein [Priestia megaterium]|uniref:hypothetical protein n=1 Tax=Priestia megaterium TaxID=1404 RepID=UPI003008E7D5
MNNIWKQVANSWRTIEQDSGSNISIEELMNNLMNEIKEGEFSPNAYDYLDSDNDDDDDDWP